MVNNLFPLYLLFYKEVKYVWNIKKTSKQIILKIQMKLHRKFGRDIHREQAQRSSYEEFHKSRCLMEIPLEAVE